MNGALKRTFEAVAVRRVTVFSIREGRSVSFEPGDRFTVHEDTYGNTYVDGVFVNPRNFAERS